MRYFIYAENQIRYTETIAPNNHNLIWSTTQSMLHGKNGMTTLSDVIRKSNLSPQALSQDGVVQDLLNVSIIKYFKNVLHSYSLMVN